MENALNFFNLSLAELEENKKKYHRLLRYLSAGFSAENKKEFKSFIQQNEEVSRFLKKDVIPKYEKLTRKHPEQVAGYFAKDTLPEMLRNFLHSNRELLNDFAPIFELFAGKAS